MSKTLKFVTAILTTTVIGSIASAQNIALPDAPVPLDNTTLLGGTFANNNVAPVPEKLQETFYNCLDCDGREWVAIWFMDSKASGADVYVDNLLARVVAFTEFCNENYAPCDVKLFGTGIIGTQYNLGTYEDVKIARYTLWDGDYLAFAEAAAPDAQSAEDNAAIAFAALTERLGLPSEGLPVATMPRPEEISRDTSNLEGGEYVARIQVLPDALAYEATCSTCAETSTVSFLIYPDQENTGVVNGLRARESIPAMQEQCSTQAQTCATAPVHLSGWHGVVQTWQRDGGHGIDGHFFQDDLYFSVSSRHPDPDIANANFGFVSSTVIGLTTTNREMGQ